jgi:iron(III) transport system ATP-binding protein
MAEIALNDVRLRLGESDVLKGVTLTAPDAKVVALVGPADSGKTALLRAIAGLARPHAGSIRLGERVLFDAKSRMDVPAQRRGVGLLSQSESLWPQWSVFDNIAHCAQLASAGKGDIKVRTIRALEQVGAIELALRYPPQLSAAERRRIALARTLVMEPPVLLLDDPLSHLDFTPRAQARAWLRAFVSAPERAVIIATRNPVEAMAVADHIVLLNAGAVEQQGTPADLYSEPTTVFGFEFMGRSNRLEGTLLENAATQAFVDVKGCRIGGITQTRAAIGSAVTGVIRVERTAIGGGPGVNRIPMTLKAQMFLGERWELVFVRDDLTVRAYASAPLRHSSYHVEFPADALWVF